ncbi:MAG: CoA transferase [Actinomycetia bacterium]|nr:CoA transferase [Actinomycetes bacterium]
MSTAGSTPAPTGRSPAWRSTPTPSWRPRPWAGTSEPPPVTNPVHQPLLGVEVVEFCTIAAGPFCAMILSDLGAEVVKVEPPGGDPMRTWPPLTEGFSENFASLNRNKRSIELDLKDPGDRTTARALCARADIVLENNRPGVMDRLGLGWAELSANHPELVYASISAYGQTGPRSHQGGFDVVLQAFSGIMSVTGEPGRAPVKAGVPVSDFATGLYAALSITAALANVRAGAPGCHVDASMLGSSLGIAALQTSEYMGNGVDPRPLGSAHPRNAPYRAFATADQPVVVAAGNDKLWASVAEVIGRPDLLDDPRFGSVPERAANQDALLVEMETALAGRGVDHWVAAFTAAGVPCSPVNTYGQALADGQIDHLGLIEDLALPSGPVTRTVGATVGFSGERQALRRSPPGLDEHGAELRAELG